MTAAIAPVLSRVLWSDRDIAAGQRRLRAPGCDRRERWTEGLRRRSTGVSEVRSAADWPPAAAVTRLAALAGNLALLSGAHRREAALGSSITLRTGHCFFSSSSRCDLATDQRRSPNAVHKSD